MNLMCSGRVPFAGSCPRSIRPVEQSSLFCALSRASALVTIAASHQLLQVLVERLHADADWPVWIDEYICAILFSRIRLRIAGVPIMISCAATRPWPSLVFSSVCEITARSDSDSIARTISFSAAGNTSTMRSMVLAAELVCSVPNTRWPVSAAVSARRIVSRSRISPTRMHVRVLAQRRAQRFGERQRVRSDLALVDQALLRLVHELDRVLDREDVAVLVLVDVVDHRRERGRLARAGRAGDQHQAARLVGQVGEDLRARSGPRATGSSTEWSGTPRRRRGSG